MTEHCVLSRVLAEHAAERVVSDAVCQANALFTLDLHTGTERLIRAKITYWAYIIRTGSPHTIMDLGPSTGRSRT